MIGSWRCRSWKFRHELVEITALVLSNSSWLLLESNINAKCSNDKVNSTVSISTLMFWDVLKTEFTWNVASGLLGCVPTYFIVFVIDIPTCKYLFVITTFCVWLYDSVRESIQGICKHPTDRFEDTIVWERWHFWRSEINIVYSLIQCIRGFCSSPLPIFKLSLQVPWIDSL